MFDDETMPCLEAFLGIQRTLSQASIPITVNPTLIQVQHTQLTQDAQNAEVEDTIEATATTNDHSRKPLPVMHNSDLNEVSFMNRIADENSVEENNDEDDDIIKVDDIVGHYWMPNTNDIRLPISSW